VSGGSELHIWLKIQGLVAAARPIITASQPVTLTMRSAFRGVDIAVTDHGMADGLFDGGDQVPVGCPTVALGSGTRVDSDAFDAGVLGPFFARRRRLRSFRPSQPGV